MITLEMLCVQVRGLREADVRGWIEQSWVRPDGQSGRYLFHEIDVARVRLIVELRDEMQVGEEALPVVLSLLDQLYEARRSMRQLRATLERAETGISLETLREEMLRTLLSESRLPEIGLPESRPAERS